jgi:hypothetical protein
LFEFCPYSQASLRTKQSAHFSHNYYQDSLAELTVTWLSFILLFWHHRSKLNLVAMRSESRSVVSSTVVVVRIPGIPRSYTSSFSDLSFSIFSVNLAASSCPFLISSSSPAEYSSVLSATLPHHFGDRKISVSSATAAESMLHLPEPETVKLF